MTFRVLVTGSRDWADRQAILNALAEQFFAHDAVTVVHGHCPTGADAIAAFRRRVAACAQLKRPTNA